MVDKSNKKEILLEMKKEIEPKTKFWNQNSLFLVFGFSSAILLTSGLELFKIIGRDYSFKFDDILYALISFGKQDYYLIGILMFFIFGWVIAILSARIIDKQTKHFNLILNWLNRELK